MEAVEKASAAYVAKRPAVQPTKPTGPKPGPLETEKPPSLNPNDEQRMPIDVSDSKADRPEWKVGYEWTYTFREPNRSGGYTTEVVREETYEGVPAYVLKTAKYEYFFTKDNMSFVAVSSAEGTHYKKDPPEPYFSWPLIKDKQWRNSYRFGIPKDRYWETVQTRLVVTAVEKVQVSAGSFLAFKIVHYDHITNKVIAERWYSPEVRWYVKQKEYDKETELREVELMRFKIN
jgi:hypothetical protein